VSERDPPRAGSLRELPRTCSGKDYLTEEGCDAELVAVWREDADGIHLSVLVLPCSSGRRSKLALADSGPRSGGGRKNRPRRPLGTAISTAAVREKLGFDFVEYDSFVAARLPAGAAKALTAAALAEKRGVFRDTRPPAMLPFQSFHPEDAEERWTRWRGQGLPPAPVPDLFLIRFAFPLLDEWTEALRECGADPILYYGNEMFLIRARNLGVIQSCQPAARYLAWADAFRVTDRTSPELLDTADLDFRPWSLVFVPGTDLDTALAELPAAMETGGHMTWEDGTLSLGVRAGRPELEDLARTSLHLMSILEAEGEPQPSDERQGQILAGNYVGYPAAAAGAVTTPGYLSWLAGRGLRTTTNPQTVAVLALRHGRLRRKQRPQ
jgi:hypothetical protein